jgi:hypothetical protein
MFPKPLKPHPITINKINIIRIIDHKELLLLLCWYTGYPIGAPG